MKKGPKGPFYFIVIQISFGVPDVDDFHDRRPFDIAQLEIDAPPNDGVFTVNPTNGFGAIVLPKFYLLHLHVTFSSTAVDGNNGLGDVGTAGTPASGGCGGFFFRSASLRSSTRMRRDLAAIAVISVSESRAS